MALKEATIYVESDGDRNCPNCKSEDIQEVKGPALVHNRTEMLLQYYCPHCGCDFRFRYTLFVSGIEVQEGGHWPL